MIAHVPYSQNVLVNSLFSENMHENLQENFTVVTLSSLTSYHVVSIGSIIRKVLLAPR